MKVEQVFRILPAKQREFLKAYKYMYVFWGIGMVGALVFFNFLAGKNAPPNPLRSSSKNATSATPKEAGLFMGKSGEFDLKTPNGQTYKVKASEEKIKISGHGAEYTIKTKEYGIVIKKGEQRIYKIKYDAATQKLSVYDANNVKLARYKYKKGSVRKYEGESTQYTNLGGYNVFAVTYKDLDLPDHIRFYLNAMKQNLYTY